MSLSEKIDVLFRDKVISLPLSEIYVEYREAGKYIENNGDLIYYTKPGIIHLILVDGKYHPITLVKKRIH